MAKHSVKIPERLLKFIEETDKKIVMAKSGVSEPRRLSSRLARFIEETDKLPLSSPPPSRMGLYLQRKKSNVSEEMLCEIERRLGAKRK